MDGSAFVEQVHVDGRTRVLLLAVRRALIMILCALEDYLEMDKTRR